MYDPIRFDYSMALAFFSDQELKSMENQVRDAHYMLHEKKGLGKDCLGWLDLPMTLCVDGIDHINTAVKKIQNDSDVLIVIGVGGSYLGARAAIEMLTHSFYNSLSTAQRKTPQIFFVGNHLSSIYIRDLLQYLEGKDVSLNVISKSGTTTEPAIAFRIFKGYMEEKYGVNEARQRIYATTSIDKGSLSKLAELEGYKTFSIPEDIGGRYSVLTAVGLLPIAVSGINIEEMLEGAREACTNLQSPDLKVNGAYQYAAIRNLLYTEGKAIEILVHYEPSLHFFAEWWKQLFGESEGKDGKGIFPASANFTTDLHSFGQYIQDGKRQLFETVLHVEKTTNEISVTEQSQNLDDLDYLNGISLDTINEQACKAAALAHSDGGVPNLFVRIPELSPFYFGYLVYFFQKACAVSGYLLGVNPFDQPGVEAYKQNMFQLLGKRRSMDTR